MKPAHYPSFNFDLSENVAYNNSTLPAYIREGLLSLYPDYSACSHWHEDLEFLIVRSGSMTYNVNGRLIELNTGEGIFVNSRQLHYGFSATRSECDFICILLHPRLLAANQTFYHNFVTPFLKNEECPYVHLQPNINWNSDILTMLMELFCAMGNETALFLIQRHFFHMFELLYSHAPAKVDGHVPPSPNLNTVLK